MTGTNAIFLASCLVPIGLYCEIHAETSPSNTETPLSSPAIALNSPGTLQGSHFFLNFVTNQHVICHQWPELPLIQDIFRRVHLFAHNENNVLRANPNFTLY